jgi:hypothetical protein
MAVVSHCHSTLSNGVLQIRNAGLRAVGLKSEFLPIPTTMLEIEATLRFRIVLRHHLCCMKDQARFPPDRLGTKHTGSRRNNRQFLQHIVRCYSDVDDTKHISTNLDGILLLHVTEDASECIGASVSLLRERSLLNFCK